MNPGLCGQCRHGRAVPGAHSTFWFCERSRTDPAYPRYPRLPVLRCPGFEGPSAGSRGCSGVPEGPSAGSRGSSGVEEVR